jgi:hypothetical protein
MSEPALDPPRAWPSELADADPALTVPRTVAVVSDAGLGPAGELSEPQAQVRAARAMARPRAGAFLKDTGNLLDRMKGRLGMKDGHGCRFRGGVRRDDGMGGRAGEFVVCDERLGRREPGSDEPDHMAASLGPELPPRSDCAHAP